MIFLIADNHFSDYDGPDDVIHVFNRPYRNSYEMNLDMITKWNSVVSNDDRIFIIGDFAWKWDEIHKFSEKLNGKKYFIMGNHDFEGDRKWDVNAEFHEGIFPLISILAYGGRDFLLVHRPEDVPKWWKGWVIHGHHHWMLPKYPFIDGKNKNINVACELVDFAPVNFDQLIALNIDQIKRMDTINSKPEFW